MPLCSNEHGFDANENAEKAQICAHFHWTEAIFVAMSHYRNARNHWKNGQFFPSKGIDATQKGSRKYDEIRIKGSECRCRQRTHTNLSHLLLITHLLVFPLNLAFDS